MLHPLAGGDAMLLSHEGVIDWVLEWAMEGRLATEVSMVDVMAV